MRDERTVSHIDVSSHVHVCCLMFAFKLFYVLSSQVVQYVNAIDAETVCEASNCHTNHDISIEDFSSKEQSVINISLSNSFHSAHFVNKMRKSVAIFG